MNKFFLKQSIDAEKIKEGKVSGVAYSGALIANFGFYENFIVDVESLTFAKEKTPLLKDHNCDRVVGFANASKDEFKILIDGMLSKKIEDARDIIALSEDGFEWEMSIGVYDGRIEEEFTGEVNGIEVEKAIVLRDGVLREVSIVSLGADNNTSLEVLNKNIKENEVMSKEFKKLRKIFKLEADAEVIAIEEKAEEVLEKIVEVEKEVDERDALIQSLKEEIQALKDQLEAISEESEAESREEDIEASMKKAGISLSAEKIKEIANTKEGTEMFLSAMSEVKTTKISDEFSKKHTFSKKKVEGTVSLRDQANMMVKDGKAKDFLQALNMLQEQGE